MIEISTNEQLAGALSRRLTRCTKTLFAGRVSGRIHETIAALVNSEITTRGGNATIIRTDPTTAQGFSLTAYGTTTSTALVDGLTLGILRLHSGKEMTDR